MKTEIKFELECAQHYWNFSTEALARQASKTFSQCSTGFTIKEVSLNISRDGKVLKRKERELK